MLYGGVTRTERFTFEPQVGKMGSEMELRPTLRLRAKLFERPFEKLKNTP